MASIDSVICLILTACSPDVTPGFGPIFKYCANLETQQTTLIGASETCPSDWVEGVINECTNIRTGEVELKLMSSRLECPEGYTGARVHDECETFDHPDRCK